jgi:hypothetical protein
VDHPERDDDGRDERKASLNFCAKSYAEGVKGGGKFPARKAAFMDAWEEGVSLAG